MIVFWLVLFVSGNVVRLREAVMDKGWEFIVSGCSLVVIVGCWKESIRSLGM